MRSGSTVAIAAALMLLVIWPDRCAGDPEALAILARCEQSLSAVHSLRFRVENEMFEPNQQGQKVFMCTADVVYADGRYRSEVHGRNLKTGEAMETVSAFDGRRHQWLINQLLVLSNRRRLPSPTQCATPMEMCFLFLSGQSIKTFAELRNPQTWRNDALIKGSSYLGTEMHAGMECHKVRLPWLGAAGGSEEGHWTVWFAPKRNYFPVRSVFERTGQGRLAVEARRFFHVEASDCAFDLPTEVIQSASVAPGQSDSPSEVVVRVDPTSIQLNAAFDEDFFIIPVSQANSVNDVDAKTMVRTASEISSVTEVSRSRFWAVLLLGLIIAGTAGSWWIWRRRRR